MTIKTTYRAPIQCPECGHLLACDNQNCDIAHCINKKCMDVGVRYHVMPPVELVPVEETVDTFPIITPLDTDG